MTKAIEAGARAAALVQGDDFDKIPRDKQHWIEDRGQFNGRYRDINEPFQSCYLEMSEEVIKAAIASGALVQASVVAECLSLIEKEGELLIEKAHQLQAFQQATKPAYSEADLHEQAGTAILGAVQKVRQLDTAPARHHEITDDQIKHAHELAEDRRRAWADLAPASGDYVVGWRDISTARKDRTPILAKFFDDIYPRIEPQRPDLESWNGLQVVIRQPGIPDSGFDMGWSVAAPVGNGGLPDRWIEGWTPLLNAASRTGGGE